jgi:SAM-dependent methyltransferase
LLELVGPVDGLRLLDLACGQGRVTRDLIRRGATVIGLDVSERLPSRARATEQATLLGAHYVHGDAAGSVNLPAKSFDSVVCNYGLSDIDDLAGALANVRTLLRSGGSFVFSMLHPCFPGWGDAVSSSWPPGRGSFAEGLVALGRTCVQAAAPVGANHRTISTYLTSLRRTTSSSIAFWTAAGQRWRSQEPNGDPVPTFLPARCTHRRQG